MSEKTTLKIGHHCFVFRPEYSFAGRVVDVHEDRVRVAGNGSVLGCRYDEWFPIECKLLQVEPGPFLDTP